MNILKAPFYALFSLDFYRGVIRAPLGQGFQYLLYLSGLTTILALFSFMSHGLPLVRDMMDWVKAEMPIITLTGDGLSLNEPSPFTMVHPALGPLVTFDVTKTDITSAETGDALVFITATKAYVKEGAAQLREYDLLSMFQLRRRGVPVDRTAVITPESIQEAYDSLKPLLVIGGIILFFPFFFLWKLLAGLFYAWFGLLINYSRRSPLTFSAVYNTSLFAMTASIVFQWIRFLIPVLDQIPFSGFLGVLLTIFYLYLSIKKTEEISEKSSQG